MGGRLGQGSGLGPPSDSGLPEVTNLELKTLVPLLQPSVTTARVERGRDGGDRSFQIP